jgi:hypothetical protein
VVYLSLTYQHLCYREIGEFTDGRFERVWPVARPAETGATATGQ